MNPTGMGNYARDWKTRRRESVGARRMGKVSGADGMLSLKNIWFLCYKT